jgi:succinyl-diaminopimelate desuccinylase
MADPLLLTIQDWLRDHEQDLLEDTRHMLRFPSVQGDPAPNAPFGQANRDALDYALALAKRFGMRTKDLDGYAAYAEVGSGDGLVVSLGHLDVVPVSPGWKHGPFAAEIEDGYLYGRGTTDDKGPTMASFYAVRALKECLPQLGCRVRQVFGCNEESGFKCVERYVQVEGGPTFGIAPDSSWPLVHGEKNIATLTLEAPLYEGKIALRSLKGGERVNIVIDRAEAKLWVSPTVRNEVEEKLAGAWDRNVTFSWSGDDLDVVATGKAAHGATPFMGDSAATRLFRFLVGVAPSEAVESLANYLKATHPSGVGIGVHGRDEETGDLTANLGVMTSDRSLHLSYSIRYPVTWSADYLRSRLEIKATELGWSVEKLADSPGLFFPLDHPLVKTILDVHEAETGIPGIPEVIGGGTYARAIPNTVSIGTCWEGDGYAHETNERIRVEHLFKASRIYAHVLYRLSLQA